MGKGLQQYLGFMGQSQQLMQAVQSILEREANFLHKCLNNAIDDFYSSYTPTVYKRTWRFRDSVRIERKVQRDSEGFTMRVYFDEGASTHPSIIDPKHADGFVPILWNQGWAWAHQPKHGLYRFSFFPYGATHDNYKGNASAFQGDDRIQFVDHAIRMYLTERGNDALPVIKVVTYGGDEIERTPFNP